MGKSPKGVVVQLKGPIKRGDGIVLDRGKKRHQKEERRGRVVEGRKRGKGRKGGGEERREGKRGKGKGIIREE